MSFKVKFGICGSNIRYSEHGCGTSNIPFAHNARKLCKRCNEAFKTAAKSKLKRIEQVVVKTSGNRSKGGQKAMFEKIWEEREHFSVVSGKKLFPKTHYQWHWQFAHVLPKGNYTYYKLNPDNIVLLLPNEHNRLDHAVHTIKDDPDWSHIFDMKEKLRQEYNAEYL